MKNKTWEEKFDEKFEFSMDWIRMNHKNEFITGVDIENLDIEIKQFITQTISEIAEEQIEKINKRKEEVRKSEGAFKYDWCFEDCIKIIKKHK